MYLKILEEIHLAGEQLSGKDNRIDVVKHDLKRVLKYRSRTWAFHSTECYGQLERLCPTVFRTTS